MRKHSKLGQSILEYTLLLAAIIAVLVVVLLGQGGISSKVGDTYNATGNALGKTAERLDEGIWGD